MKKPFSFDKRSETVFCSNSKCAKVRGAESITRRAIKKNVVARNPEGKPLVCYDCGHFAKTGQNRHQRLSNERKRRSFRVAQAEESRLKDMAANN